MVSRGERREGCASWLTKDLAERDIFLLDALGGGDTLSTCQLQKSLKRSASDLEIHTWKFRQKLSELLFVCCTHSAHARCSGKKT